MSENFSSLSISNILVIGIIKMLGTFYFFSIMKLINIPGSSTSKHESSSIFHIGLQIGGIFMDP